MIERSTMKGERQKDGEGMGSKGQRADGEQRRSEEKIRQIDVKGKKDEKEEVRDSRRDRCGLR